MVKSLANNDYDMDSGDLEEDFGEDIVDSPAYRIVKMSDRKYLATIVFDSGDIEDLGVFTNRESAENSAQQWIDEYVNLDD